MDERSYGQGSRAAWSRMLQECLTHLGYDSQEAGRSSWIMEREAAISSLRQVCGTHGDNDWEDDLHLADVIDKHLANHLG